MSAKHLAQGSVEPPKVEGLLRLYSMEYCPFAQRTRLILQAKGLPHDIVNINLTKKPDWYFKIHPEGKVPALFDGSDNIIESLIISDYLDEKYPEPPLYPSDPKAIEEDKKLIEKIAPIAGKFYQAATAAESKSKEEWVKELVEVLDVFEQELKKRGTPFLGGDKPGMVDYMLWPWLERKPLVISNLLGDSDSVDAQLPLLKKYRDNISKDPAVQKTFNTIETYKKFYKFRTEGIYDFDNL